jgi:hypothetical protein
VIEPWGSCLADLVRGRSPSCGCATNSRVDKDSLTASCSGGPPDPDPDPVPAPGTGQVVGVDRGVQAAVALFTGELSSPVGSALKDRQDVNMDGLGTMTQLGGVAPAGE